MSEELDHHPMKCVNCGESAVGHVHPWTAYVVRIVCDHCDYVETR